MPIKVTCKCGKVTNVPDAYAGRTGKCPACKQPVKVPDLQAAAVAAPAIAPEPAYEPTLAPPQHPHAYEPDPAPVAEPEPQYEAEHEQAPVEPEYAVDESHEVSQHEQERATAQLQHAAPAEGDGGIIAPPPSDAIRIPTTLAQNLRQPDCAPLHVVLSTVGSDIRTKFDASPVLQQLVEALAKGLKKKFDVRLDAPTPGDSAPIVFIRIIQIHPGVRALRYLGLITAWLGGATSFEVDGNVQPSGQEPVAFAFKNRAYFGLLGGNPLGLLKLNAKVVAKKIAGKVKSASK